MNFKGAPYDPEQFATSIADQEEKGTDLEFDTGEETWYLKEKLLL